MAPRPLFTIVTACKDAADTIQATLESVARQSCQDLEHLIIDGASRDDTCARVRAAANERVRLQSAPDGGVYEAFNRGLAAARGELIAFLAADDVYADAEVLARVREVAARHPEAELFHGDLDFVDASGRVVGRWRHRAERGYAELAVRNVVAHPTVFARRSLFERLGPFDGSYRVAGDYEHLLRCWRAGVRFQHVPAVLVHMRPGGLSHRAHLRCGLEVFRAAHAATGAWWGPARQLAHHALTTELRQRAPGLLRRAQRLKRALVGSPVDDVVWGP